MKHNKLLTLLSSIALLMLFLGLASCNPGSTGKTVVNITAGDQIPVDLNKFLLSFEKTILSKNFNKISRYIDTDYKKEQLANVAGNIQQFINELFCGEYADTREFMCVELNNIQSIRLIEMKLIEEDLYNAVYEISIPGRKLIVDWDIRKASNNRISGYGFIGAFG